MSTLKGFEKELRSMCIEFNKTEVKYDIILSEKNYSKFQTLLKRNGMTFTVRHSGIRDENKKRISWSSSSIPFFNKPFFIDKKSHMECTNGPKYYRGKSNRTTVKSILQDHNTIEDSDCEPVKKLKCRKTQSKKVGCNASMKVVVIKVYTEYSIEDTTSQKYEKMKIMKCLKDTLKSDPTSVVIETLCYISFSTKTVHCHSIWTSYTGQQLDRALKNEIRKLVECGITNTQTIRSLLCKWVKENIGDVNNLSRAYWPTKKTILNHVLKYAPRISKSNRKTEKSASLGKIDRRKMRCIKKKSNYETCISLLECLDSSENEIYILTSETSELQLIENSSNHQMYCPSSETSDSMQLQLYVMNSKIRELIKVIYDRSVFLPQDCCDPVLCNNLQTVVRVMNTHIDNNQKNIANRSEYIAF